MSVKVSSFSSLDCHPILWKISDYFGGGRSCHVSGRALNKSVHTEVVQMLPPCFYNQFIPDRPQRYIFQSFSVLFFWPMELNCTRWLNSSLLTPDQIVRLWARKRSNYLSSLRNHITSLRFYVSSCPGLHLQMMQLDLKEDTSVVCKRIICQWYNGSPLTLVLD